MIADTNNKFVVKFEYLHEKVHGEDIIEEKRSVLFKACIRNLLLYKAITGGKDLFDAVDEYKKVFDQILKSNKAFDVMDAANKSESEISETFSKNTETISEVFAMLNDTKIDETSGLTFSDLLYKVMYISAQPQNSHNELIAMSVEEMFDFEVMTDPSLFLQLINTQLHFVEQYRKYEKKKTHQL